MSNPPTNIPTLMFLSNKNHHKRDEEIQFEEESHTYTILCDPNVSYTSVTTFVHEQFEKFDADLIIGRMMASPYWNKNKYYGKTPFEIKAGWEENRDQAATAGTKIHYDIECYYNEFNVSNDTIEYQYFKDFIEKHQHLKAFRTEWTVFDTKLKIAGSIDMVFFNEKDNCYYIYDWKRCREIKKANSYKKYSTNPVLSDLPDTNYWHYTLQLNIYKYILEKNYEMKIAGCVLVCLHPDNKNKTFQLYKLPLLDELVDNLFNVRLEKLKSNENINRYNTRSCKK